MSHFTEIKAKKYISPSSPAVSRSLTGCFVEQNIGEVSARTEGLIKTAALLDSFFSLLRRMNK